MPDRAEQEYLSASDLARITGRSARYYQKLAKAGTLPFVSRPQENGPYFFDRKGFYEWIEGRQSCLASTGQRGGAKKQVKRNARRIGGAARPSTAKNTTDPLTQRLEALRKSG